MMNKEQMSVIYEIGKKVVSGSINEKDASLRIYRDYGLNQTSLIYYFRSLKNMLEGSNTYAISIGSAIREFFLLSIYKEFGAERLRIALKQFLIDIEYYEHSHGDRIQKKNRELYQKYCDLLNK